MQAETITKVLQSDYDTLDEYLDAALDCGEENNPELIIPRYFYYDLMYEYLLSNLTGASPSTYGYWTSSPSSSISNYAWIVYYNGGLDIYYVDNGSRHSVRPVIEIS